MQRFKKFLVGLGRVLAWLVPFLSALATLTIAYLTYENIKLTRQSILMDKYPIIRASLEREMSPKIPHKYKESNKKLSWWATASNSVNYVVLKVLNRQNAPIGHAMNVKVEYKITFPRFDDHSEEYTISRIAEFDEVNPGENLSHISFKFPIGIPFFRVEIMSVRYFNYLTGKDNYLKNFSRNCISEKSRDDGSMREMGKIFK